MEKAKKGNKPLIPPELADAIKVGAEIKVESFTPPPKIHCDGCGQELARLRWNSRADILICNNGRCGKWHQPQGYIKINQEVL